MSIIYSQNFDSTTVGTLPSGWSPVASSAWAVSAAASVSPPNSLIGPISSGDGTKIVYTGSGTLADMDIRYDVAVVAAFVGVLLRSDTNAQNCYVILPNTPGNLNSTWNIFKIVGGSPTQIDSFSVGGLATGNISIRARIQGSQISFRIWAQGTTEPGTWNRQFTDTSITAAGYPGFYNQGLTSTGGGSGIDNFALDNLAALAVSPTSVLTSSTGNSLTLTGTATAWTAGTPGTPTFTVSGGTITGQVVHSATSATLTYTAPGSPGSVTITDPSTTATAVLTVNAGATDFTFTPSNLNTTAGTATGNYTITPNGTPSSSVSVALSDGGAGGAFTPTGPLTFNSSTGQTVTYTPPGGASPGAITLTATATGGLTTNHSVTCTVQAGPQTLPVTNAALFFSPGNWDHLVPSTFGVSKDTMQATAAGAYLKFNVSGTVNLAIGIDNATNSGFPSGDMPTLCYSIDNGVFQVAQLAPSATSLTLSSSLSTGSHQVEIYFKASSQTIGFGDCWGSSGVSPTNVLRINGVTIDAGGALAAPTLRTKRAIFFGDSITAGEHVNTDGSDDATQSYVPMMALALQAEFGQTAYGGQGWEATGGSNVPGLITGPTYNLYSVGRARTMTGFDYALVCMGGNDARAGSPPSGAQIQADCQAWLTAMRAACGSGTQLIVLTECMGSYATNLQAAVTAYKAANPSDTKVQFVNVTTYFPAGVFSLNFGATTQWTFDGVHPLIYGHGRIGSAYSEQVGINLGGGGGGGSNVRAIGFSGGFEK